MSLNWLFLDMNSFFASVEQQENPKLRGRPVGVVPMLADSTCCIAASYEAKAFGVRTGTNVAEAKRMCPEIILVEANHRPYRDYHNRIVDVVGTCTPVDKILSVDEMVCRLWSNDRSRGNALDLGNTIKSAIHRDVGECLHCSVGVSLNPFLAKVAAELEKPNGLVILDDDALPQSLYPLALTDFPGINRNMAERFRSHGVFTTEQMYARSIVQMREIWGGIAGERWWRLLRGEDIALPDNPRRSVSHSHVLPPSMRTASGAWAIEARLLEKAAERMRHLGLQAQALGVSARAAGSGAWDAHMRFTATSDTLALMETLSRLWRPPFAAPMKVGVVLYDLKSADDVTLSLFDDIVRRDRGNAAVDKLNQKYGRGTVTLACALPAVDAREDKIAFGKVQELG